MPGLITADAVRSNKWGQYERLSLREAYLVGEEGLRSQDEWSESGSEYEDMLVTDDDESEDEDANTPVMGWSRWQQDEEKRRRQTRRKTKKLSQDAGVSRGRTTRRSSLLTDALKARRKQMADQVAGGNGEEESDPAQHAVRISELVKLERFKRGHCPRCTKPVVCMDEGKCSLCDHAFATYRDNVADEMKQDIGNPTLVKQILLRRPPTRSMSEEPPSTRPVVTTVAARSVDGELRGTASAAEDDDEETWMVNGIVPLMKDFPGLLDIRHHLIRRELADQVGGKPCDAIHYINALMQSAQGRRVLDQEKGTVRTGYVSAFVVGMFTGPRTASPAPSIESDVASLLSVAVTNYDGPRELERESISLSDFDPEKPRTWTYDPEEADADLFLDILKYYED